MNFSAKIISSFLVIFSILIASCNDTDYKLKGMWKLKSIANEENGLTSEDSVYYLFDNGIFQYIHLEEVDSTYRLNGAYHTIGDSLYIKINEEQGGFEFDLSKVGFREKSFYMRELSGKDLVLDAKNGTYSFKKF